MSKSERIVGLTGAGISTDSGIPAFRTTNGSLEAIWEKHDPKTARLSSFLQDTEIQSSYWQMHRSILEIINKTKPNSAHSLFVQLEKAGKLKALITQNIDDLHRVSGIPESKLIELHGNAKNAKCTKCGRKTTCSQLPPQTIPLCCDCGSVMRPDTVMFGESLNQQQFELALSLIQHDCDLLLIMGTSLQVEPVNKLPLEAIRNGSRVAIVNLSDTPCDQFCNPLVRLNCTEASNFILQSLKLT